MSDQSFISGRTALVAGRWQDARAAFESALEIEESPEAHAGLADALFWLGDARACVRHRERAYAIARSRAQPVTAAESALWLCLIYGSCLGKHTVARGWMSRLERLVVANAGAEVFAGWLDLCRALYSTEVSRCRELLERAIAFSQETDDVDLELCALGELGVVSIKQGEGGRGMQYLEEAMAGALGGERRQFETVVMTSCCMLTACDLTGDLERAAQWTRVADSFTREYGGPYLYYDCRTLYARILVLKGRWKEAEDELNEALTATREAFPGMYIRSMVALAELRIRQGRLEAAAALLQGLDAPVESSLVRAGLALASDHPRLAASLLLRWLGSKDDRIAPPVHAGGRGFSLAAAAARCLLFEAYAASGDLDAARAVAGELTERSGAAGSFAAAHAAYLQARVAEIEGAVALASSLFQAAEEKFAVLELPLEAARSRARFAECIQSTDTELALAEAREALATFERLGAAGDVGWLRAFISGIETPATAPLRVAAGLTRREQEILALLSAGLSNREIAERLYISRRTTAHHVSNVLGKLGVRNRVEATASALRLGKE